MNRLLFHRFTLAFALFTLPVYGQYAKTPAVQSPTVQVQVYDYANLDPASVHKVVALAQDILDCAGVSIEAKLHRRDFAQRRRHSALRRAWIRYLTRD